MTVSFLVAIHVCIIVSRCRDDQGNLGGLDLFCGEVGAALIAEVVGLHTCLQFGCGMNSRNLIDKSAIVVGCLDYHAVLIGNLHGSGSIREILTAGAFVVFDIAVHGTVGTLGVHLGQVIFADVNGIAVSGLQFNRKGDTGTRVGQDQYCVILIQRVTVIQIHADAVGSQLVIAYRRNRAVAEGNADPHGRKVESLSGVNDLGRGMEGQADDFGNRDVPNSCFRAAGGYPSAIRIDILLIVDLTGQCAEGGGRIDDLDGSLAVRNRSLCLNDAGFFDAPCHGHILLVTLHGVIQTEVGGRAPHITGLAQHQIQIAAESDVIFSRVCEDGCPCHADAEHDGIAIVFTDDGGDATTDSGDLTRFVHKSHRFIVAVPLDIDVRAFFLGTEAVAEHGVPVVPAQGIAVADLEIDAICPDALHRHKGQGGILFGYGQAVRPTAQHGQTVVAQNTSVHGDLHGHTRKEDVIGDEAEHAGRLQPGLNIGIQRRLLDAKGGDRRIHRLQRAGQRFAAQSDRNRVVKDAVHRHQMVELQINAAVRADDRIGHGGIAGAGQGDVHIQMGRGYIQHDALSGGVALALEDHLPLAGQHVPAVIAVGFTGIGVGALAVVLTVPQDPGLAVLLQIVQVGVHAHGGIAGRALIEVA